MMTTEQKNQIIEAVNLINQTIHEENESGLIIYCELNTDGNDFQIKYLDEVVWESETEMPADMDDLPTYILCKMRKRFQDIVESCTPFFADHGRKKGMRQCETKYELC